METIEQKTAVAVINRAGEVAVSAMAAKAKAEVEARYTIALHRPRNINQSRIAILDACKRPKFAEGARYLKPVGGGKTVDGLSIRFAEEAIKAMTNISTESMVVWEDEQKRTIHVTVTDLESNTTYGDDITISKTVERRQLKEGQVPISERMNSTGQKVYLVEATEDDIANKVNAAKSKIIRNNGLRLVPQDILEEAEEAILDTLSKGGKDPKAETKKICDAFSAIGVKPSELERLIGHSLESISPKEIIDLRATYSAIKDEETTWAAVIAQAEPKRPSKEGPTETVKASETASTIEGGSTGNQTQATTETLSGTALYNAVDALCKRDDVSHAQLIAYCKAPGRNLCGEAVTDLIAISDASLRLIHGTWKAILPHIKKIKPETLL